MMELNTISKKKRRMSAAELPPLSPSHQSSQSQSRVEVEEVTTIVKSPLLRPTPAFLKVIHYGGGQGETFTMGEILDYVKKYIDDKKLYDQRNPRIIYCKGNDLGTAFNVDQITIPEVLHVFLKHCTQEKDSRVTVSRQVNTRPLCEDQSTSSSSSSSSSTTSLSSQAPLPSQERPPSPSAISAASLLTSSNLPSSCPVVSSSTSAHSQNEHQSTTTTPHTVPAAGPSTTISYCDLETTRGDNSNAVCPPSSSFSITAMDETDGGDIPWACQVEAEDNDDENGGHNSLVVEYSSDNFSVEYELMSSSDAESYHRGDTEASRSPSESTPATAFYLVCEESDIEYLADYSETDSDDSDAELGEDDKWECNMCQFRNSALYRNCGKCWSLRPDWLPSCRSPRPKGAQNLEGVDGIDVMEKSASIASKNSSAVQTDKQGDGCDYEQLEKPFKSECGLIDDMSTCVSPANFQMSSQDSAIGSMACSQEQADSKSNVDDVKADGKIEKNKKRTYSSCLSDSQEESSGKTKVGKASHGNCEKDEKESSSKDPCVICLTRPKTACIIHGKTGHQVCCYGCARMLKKKRKPCPICRRPIQRVVRNYF